MPGYGIVGPEEGSGLLPWSWAEERLIASRNYWVATVWPDGRPHAMPVWGVWDAREFWFSSSRRARKVRNLLANPRCVVSTEGALNPVVVEGVAEVVTQVARLRRVLGLVNKKYRTEYTMELMDPATNATVRVRPRWAFGLREGDFTGSPTRWTLES
jgi:PPOX class probable F420-dependent enzyme